MSNSHDHTHWPLQHEQMALLEEALECISTAAVMLPYRALYPFQRQARTASRPFPRKSNSPRSPAPPRCFALYKSHLITTSAASDKRRHGVPTDGTCMRARSEMVRPTKTTGCARAPFDFRRA